MLSVSCRERAYGPYLFCAWLTFLNIIFSRLIHFPASYRSLRFKNGWRVLSCAFTRCFLFQSEALVHREQLVGSGRADIWRCWLHPCGQIPSSRMAAHLTNGAKEFPFLASLSTRVAVSVRNGALAGMCTSLTVSGADAGIFSRLPPLGKWLFT